MTIAATASFAAPSRVSTVSPGGMDPRPRILSSTNNAGVLEVTAGGFQGGPFQVVHGTNLTSSSWTPIGPTATNNVFSARLTNSAAMDFFRVRSPMPSYAGAVLGGLACGQCHSLANGGTTPTDINYDYWLETPHAKAYVNLVAANPANATNTSCLPCHTVAFNYPGGYTIGNQALEGVQCESCHGPGGVRHRSGGDKLPAVERTAMVCGGCHNVGRVPTYQEWSESGHAKMDPDVVASISNPTSGQTSAFRCGTCHSGVFRSAMLSPSISGMPGAAESTREGIVCVACHDPHQNTPNGHQVINPLFSTNNFSLTPPTNQASFFAQYKADVNLCGQCHNARGAAWTDTSRPPHHSPQYNMLIGAIGEVPGTSKVYQPGAHALQTQKQCVSCHMPQKAAEGDSHPAITGHKFSVTTYESCKQCHPFPEELADFATGAINQQIQDVKELLNLWATTKAPETLRTKYGVRAWEYTTPGQLSNPAGVTTPGPATADQALIPAEIKKARFNLYLVLHDGSFGIHNGPHTVDLLNAARDFVSSQLR